jgi:hypothetical protein
LFCIRVVGQSKYILAPKEVGTGILNDNPLSFKLSRSIYLNFSYEQNDITLGRLQDLILQNQDLPSTVTLVEYLIGYNHRLYVFDQFYVKKPPLKFKHVVLTNKTDITQEWIKFGFKLEKDLRIPLELETFLKICELTIQKIENKLGIELGYTDQRRIKKLNDADNICV